MEDVHQLLRQGTTRSSGASGGDGKKKRFNRTMSMASMASMAHKELSMTETPADFHAHLRVKAMDLQSSSRFKQIVLSSEFETFGGFVVLFNFLIMTMEVQATVGKDAELIAFTRYANYTLLTYFTVECVARMYFMGKLFFRSSWNLLDLGVVMSGLMGVILELIQRDSTLKQLSILKSLRMIRLVRMLRLLVAFRELYVLVAGLANCMRTMFWASLLIAMVLNAWSILSVEYLHPKVTELAGKGLYESCDWCEDAFSTVWHAHMTWFQIISGDMGVWNAVGRPLAEEYHWPYLFYVASIMVVVWGLLNIIVASILDANIIAREANVERSARQAAQSQQDIWESFAALCEDIDVDGSGHISAQEFRDACKTNEGFQQHLMVMGIQEDQLLEMMDEDGEGNISFDEFVGQLTQLRTAVTRTTSFYTLRHVQHMRAQVSHQNALTQQLLQAFSGGKEGIVEEDRTKPPRKVGINTNPSIAKESTLQHINKSCTFTSQPDEVATCQPGASDTQRPGKVPTVAPTPAMKHCLLRSDLACSDAAFSSMKRSILELQDALQQVLDESAMAAALTHPGLVT